MVSYHSNFFNFFAVLTLSLGVAACGGKKVDKRKKGGDRPTNLKSEGYIVRPQSYSDDYTASGSLLPNEQVDIHPEVSGRVTKIFFTEGTHVKKGQLLVQLFDETIRATIQKSQAQKKLQQSILNRQRQLLAIGGISRQDYETTQSQIQSIDADIAFAEAQLRSTKILAPFDGTIGIRNISVGAVVSPATLISTIQQVQPLKMDFMIPDQYRKAIHNGKEVFFAIKGSLDTLSGTINAIDPGADPNTRTVRIRAIVPNRDGKLVAGSFATVIIPMDMSNNAILIPSQAIIPTTKDKQVALLQNGKAKLITVITGDRTEDRIEVLQGLKPGDTIVTTGLMQVKNGMPVKITRLRN